MTEEEARAEQEEAERLVREINSIIDRINRLNRENAELEVELDVAIRNVGILVSNCQSLDRAVYQDMDALDSIVATADLSVKHVFDALSELTTQYFTFKRLSTASKNMTRYEDEYRTRFSNYHDLRRITLGYVIGIDAEIISNESARKQVETAYLQNTDYWLAYCISAVMLWKENEPEAAARAVNKALSMHYFNACLFFLLINLRFDRIDAAKKWYVNYLDRADQNDLGDEWQYLLQAYLLGAFGQDENFASTVAHCFTEMLTKLEVSQIDFRGKVEEKAKAFAIQLPHTSRQAYVALGRTCTDYPSLHALLTSAEKNALLTRYYDNLLEKNAQNLPEELPIRIENVLYALISAYDPEEEAVVSKIKYNEAIISARGDVAQAEALLSAAREEKDKKKNLGDLLLAWAFQTGTAQTDPLVVRFAVSFMKESIVKGFDAFVSDYRAREKDEYAFVIDDCHLTCGENTKKQAEQTLDAHYDKNKFANTIADKYVQIWGVVCLVSLLLLLIQFGFFSPVILTIGILGGLFGSFLLWRRLVEMGKILKEKKRKGKALLTQALDELARLRADYHAADAQNADLIQILSRF